MDSKEFLYVGGYFDEDNVLVLKIGTTNDLDRRRAEHIRNYKRAKQHYLPKNGTFEYFWHISLSKYNTLRYEDLNRQMWKDSGIGEFIRNDRFVCPNSPDAVTVKIRKEYKISLVG